MDLILNNKVVIVTGGFGSIGKAISIKLCEEGAIPCILDSDTAALRAFANEMGTRGYEVFAGEVFGGQLSACRRVMEEIISRYHRINGVVNIAGPYSVVGLAIQSLKESTGTIVNICPGDGRDSCSRDWRGSADLVPGLRQELTMRWAAAFSALGIRVNGVIVGHCQDEPEEVADMVLFLLSQRSRLVNGELLEICNS